MGYNILLSYDVYDKSGRILQVTDKSRIPTSYIGGGHGGLYPVAKIVNCTIAEVMRISSLTTLQATPLSGNLPDSAKNRLYDDATKSGNNYQVSVYDYVPFIGISRMIDPSGRSIYYEYGDDGKLSTVRDDQGNPVRDYIYHTVF